MPAIRSLAISFGLVTVPVAVVTATESHNVNFHRIHLADNGRVRNRYICEAENREVTYQDIGQGYEMPDGRIIPITDEELENLPLPTVKAIELVAFMPTASIDPIRIGRGYYLRPEGDVAARPYVLLRKALERQSKVGVAKFALSGRERLGLLRVRGSAIVLHSMHWPDEIRNPTEVMPPSVEVSEEEIDGAMALMEAMAIDSLEAAEFRDTYTDALSEVIAAKQEHRELPEVPQLAAEPGRVMDLMAALRESVTRAQAARSEDAEAKVPELPMKKAAKKAPTKKQPPTEDTAKKASRVPAAPRLTRDHSERRIRVAVRTRQLDVRVQRPLRGLLRDRLHADALCHMAAALMDTSYGRALADAPFHQPLGRGRPCLDAALPLGFAALFVGDPPVDEGELPYGLLFHDATGESQHVEPGQRTGFVHKFESRSVRLRRRQVGACAGPSGTAGDHLATQGALSLMPRAHRGLTRLLPLVFPGPPAALPSALPAALRNGASWLHCALPSYLGASEPGDGSLVRLSLETRSDREDLQSRPPVAIRWVGYGVEEPVDDAIARGPTVETSSDVILLLVEVQLPAVPQFRGPGV
ncbi:hypothetical protein GCM10027074_60100 [Streptomyces deserti]